MDLKATCFPYRLLFKEPAGTSRGVLHSKETWFLVLSHAGHTSVGECAVFRGLSYDDRPDYGERLEELCRRISHGETPHPEQWADYPSIRFGLEMALGRLEAELRGETYLASPFTDGQDSIPINGLVWMGDFEQMALRLEAKLRQGFRCIKIKIGAIDFERELELLSRIRARYTPREVKIRVDANGAFSPRNALERLQRLAAFELHSIEQPIAAGAPEEMARLCEQSPLPIALDEELIGVNDPQEKRRLLKTIRPHYLVLKPSLVGGLEASRQWIEAAGEVGAGYWITSALESNVGLDAIARFSYLSIRQDAARQSPLRKLHFRFASALAFSYLCRNPLPQGLGTGGLFTNNIPYPFDVSGGRFRITAPVPGGNDILKYLGRTN